MDTSALSESFLDAVRAYIERDLNYEYSWLTKKLVRKRDRGKYDAEFSQKELPFIPVDEIIDFEDFTFQGGYCETCEYTETRCKITYKLDSGEVRVYEYEGSFPELINALADDA